MSEPRGNIHGRGVAGGGEGGGRLCTRRIVRWCGARVLEIYDLRVVSGSCGSTTSARPIRAARSGRAVEKCPGHIHPVPPYFMQMCVYLSPRCSPYSRISRGQIEIVHCPSGVNYAAV